MTTPDPHDEILTVTQVAEDLKCSKSHVYKLIRGEVPNCDILPSIRLGRRRLIRRSTLERWKQDHELGGRL